MTCCSAGRPRSARHCRYGPAATTGGCGGQLIICQLGTRDRADAELLTTAIESAISDSDLFLRKAIGWALRDHARTDPTWARSFAETHELSPLSRREALKHLS